MFDAKAVTGTIMTMAAAGSTWVETANMYGQLVLTGFGIIVACLTAWYTWERARKLSKERRDKENK